MDNAQIHLGKMVKEAMPQMLPQRRRLPNLQNQRCRRHREVRGALNFHSTLNHFVKNAIAKPLSQEN